MEFNKFKINKKLFNETKTSMIKLFTFKPCECKCTTKSGIGLNLYYYGFSLAW